MRTIVSATAMLVPVLLAGLAALPAESSAAAPLCQGKSATIVDVDGGEVIGTDGDDVIIATGQEGYPAGSGHGVSALAGNDTICVDNGFVSGSSGHDAVQAISNDPMVALRLDDVEDLDIALALGGSLFLNRTGHGAGKVFLGSGSASDLRIYGEATVRVDLEDDRLNVDGGAYTLSGRNPWVIALAEKVILTGDRRPNNLIAIQDACSEVLKGGKGNDNLVIGRSVDDVPEFDQCEPEPSRVLGQRGDDQLQGRKQADVLIGGLGRDYARGNIGFDVCRAEREKHCEG
jgi:Ca2+-binding RTX toxin-like protein